MSKKKICFVAQFPPPIHGLSKAVDTLYNSYLGQKFDFQKIDISDNKRFMGNIFKIIKSDADLFYFTISQTKGGNIRDLIILKLISIKNKNCLVHLHGGYYRKLVDGLGNFQKKLNYNAVKKLVGAVVLGNSLRSIFEGMLPDDKIFVVPNCVDNEFLMSDFDFEQKINELDGSINIMYLSNFIKEKGYRQVLELAKYVKDIGDKRFKFNFAGQFFEESEREYFQSFVKENNIEDIVSYMGIVKGKEKIELLKKSNVFMLLTRYPNEGQPISILEAMGNSMAVVTTDHAGIPDIVKNGENGIMFSDNKENDIELVYNELSNMFGDNYIEVIKNNRKEVLEKYTEKKYLENLERLFEKL